MTYRAFTRLLLDLFPSKSCLQATIPRTTEWQEKDTPFWQTIGGRSRRWAYRDIFTACLSERCILFKCPVSISYLSIENGNPADTSLFRPVLHSHKKHYGCLPESIVCDGGYASKKNVSDGTEMGVKRVVFHKRVGISYRSMGVKIKTFKKLRNFRAGIEGNISELKRSFGAGKAQWKGLDGFKAFVWSSVIGYNLVRMARQLSG